MPRISWLIVAILGVCIAVDVLAQDSGLPIVPPLPAPETGPARPILRNPQTPALAPQSGAPRPAFTVPSTGVPTIPSQPAQSQVAPPPTPFHGTEYRGTLPRATSPAPYTPTAPYFGSTTPYVPQRIASGYQPDQGVDPSLYYNDVAPYGGRYPDPVGQPYYWGNAGGMGGHIRYPYYSYRRPWYNPGPAVYVFDTNIHW
ncbi:MAG: hypothetical protein IT428_02180 [Planctomycetaceae bacterium]|nr:hypothetical protein [Planctomycetaceae bacterium]